MKLLNIQVELDTSLDILFKFLQASEAISNLVSLFIL